MGLLGKSFSSKIKNMVTLALSRIAILMNHHKAVAYYARSDVAQLLSLGYHDNALLRVEHWIKEQNMLDVFVMVENYCSFLGETAELLEKNRECPDEFKEVTSSLIFASSRCGEFPELYKLREILTSKFGTEFAGHAIELPRNNRVNTKMIQKLSTKRPTVETRMKALKQIATEIGVTLHLEQEPIATNVNKLNVNERQDEVEAGKWSSTGDPTHEENSQDDLNNIIHNEDLSDRDEERKRFNDRAAAAKEGLESESYGTSEHLDHGVAPGKVHVHPMVSSSSKPEGEIVLSKSNHSFDLREMEGRELKKQLASEEFHSRQSSRDNTRTSGTKMLISNKHVIEEDTIRQDNMLGELSSAKSFLMDNDDHIDAAEEKEHFNEERTNLSYQVRGWNPQRSQEDPTINPLVRRPVSGSAGGTYFSKQIHTNRQYVDWKMMSVRTR